MNSEASNTTDGAKIGAALIAEAKRRMLDESAPRILKCLDMLTEAQIWHRPNDQSNSVGNLVLHLCGNIRQWIVSGLGEQPDDRQRDAEFEERGPLPTSELIARFESTLADAAAVMDRTEPGSLLRSRRVQGFDETGLSIIVHVVEHLSYHTGQIAYVTKATAGQDLAFYGGIDLNRKG